MKSYNYADYDFKQIKRLDSRLPPRLQRLKYAIIVIAMSSIVCQCIFCDKISRKRKACSIINEADLPAKI